MNDAVLVSRRWLERVNERLFGSSELAPETAADSSRFYDVRLVSIRGVWTYADGVWTNTAAFIENDAALTGFTFPIYAPCYNGQQTTRPNVGGRSKAFAVWRGRWELLGNNANPTTYGAGVGMYTTSSESDPNQTLLNTNAALSVVRRIENQGPDTTNPLSVYNNRIYVDGGCFKFTNVADFPCMSLQLTSKSVLTGGITDTLASYNVITAVATERITVVTSAYIDNSGVLHTTTKQIDVLNSDYYTTGAFAYTTIYAYPNTFTPTTSTIITIGTN